MQLKLKNTIIYTILGFLPLSISLIFTPIYTQYLSREDYGLLNLFTVISGILIPFFGLGIDQAAGYLYWDYSGERKKLNGFISTTILMLLLIGVVLTVAGIFFGIPLVNIFFANGNRFSLWPFLLLAMLYPLFMALNRFFLNYYRNEENIKKYAILNISALVLITAGSVCGVIIFNMGAKGAVEGRVIGFCGIVLLYMFYELNRRGISFDKRIAMLLLKMGGPLFLSTLVSSIAYIGDRLIVERFSTLEMLGIYGFSVTLASVIEISMSALGNALIPGIYKSLLDGDENDTNLRAQLFFFPYLIMALSVLFIAAITPLEILLISPRFHESLQYIPLLCAGFLPRVFSQVYIMKFYKTKNTTMVLWLSLGYLASVLLLGIPFFYFWKLKGLALSVLLTGYINLVLTYYASMKVDPFNFRMRRPIWFSILISAIIFLVTFLPSHNINPWLYYLIPFVFFILVSWVMFRSECTEIIVSVLKFIKPKA